MPPASCKIIQGPRTFKLSHHRWAALESLSHQALVMARDGITTSKVLHPTYSRTIQASRSAEGSVTQPDSGVGGYNHHNMPQMQFTPRLPKPAHQRKVLVAKLKSRPGASYSPARCHFRPNRSHFRPNQTATSAEAPLVTISQGLGGLLNSKVMRLQYSRKITQQQGAAVAGLFRPRHQRRAPCVVLYSLSHP
jgi:hypothetical protein